VTVTDSLGCQYIDSVFIAQPDNATIDYETVSTSCQNADGSIAVSVSGGTSPYTYAWSNGASGTAIDSLAPGIYGLTVTDANGCSYTTAVQLSSSSPPFVVSVDTVIYAGTTITLWAEGAVSYSWSPPDGLSCAECAETDVTPMLSTTYCVTGIDAFGCVSEACVAVNVDHDCGGIRVPNAFTPNGDGLNDVFRVLPWCIDEFRLLIYNRFGQKVFESVDPKHGWDGTFNGKHAEVGTYAFYVESRDFMGRRNVKQGNVTLIR